MRSSQGPESTQLPTFREIEPIPQWSARITLDDPYDLFVDLALRAAADTQHRYTGTLTRDPATGNVTSFTRTRFPRNKYGPPPTIEACEAGMLYLAGLLWSVATREELPPGTSRIVLGLYEGQHTIGRRHELQGTDYSLAHIATQLGADFTINPAEVFSVRLGNDGSASYYSEEAAEIVLTTVDKRQVYALGAAMKQERFSVEDFDEQSGRSYMVETQWCQEPDLPQLR